MHRVKKLKSLTIFANSSLAIAAAIFTHHCRIVVDEQTKIDEASTKDNLKLDLKVEFCLTSMREITIRA